MKASAAHTTEARLFDESGAPMNGRILAVLAAAGDRVAKEQRLVILEAMKMQHEMVASVAGRVAEIAVMPGDQFATRQVPALIRSEDEPARG